MTCSDCHLPTIKLSKPTQEAYFCTNCKRRVSPYFLVVQLGDEKGEEKEDKIPNLVDEESRPRVQ